MKNDTWIEKAEPRLRAFNVLPLYLKIAALVTFIDTILDLIKQ